ncbi:MAG: ATPase, T2SS/T4P/T4SS family [bacterium]|nr:ATPase, T2SS/T4P/T4SS family [bacterium]
MKTLIEFEQLLAQLGARGGSELFVRSGMKPVFRIDGVIVDADVAAAPITVEDVAELVRQILSPEQLERLTVARQTMVTVTLLGTQRFRLSASIQGGAYALVFRRITASIPSVATLKIPDSVQRAVFERGGLVLLIGPVDSGKTTTAAAIVQAINEREGRSIMTIESPIEYVFQPMKSVIVQRSVPDDVPDATTALAFARDEGTDVAYLDHVKNQDEAQLLLDMSIGGRLVITTVEAKTLAQAVSLFVGFFNQSEEHEVRDNLSQAFLVALNQRLVPQRAGGRVLAFEVMMANDSVRTMIRDGREQQLLQVVETSRGESMRTLDQHLVELVHAGIVEAPVAQRFAAQPDLIARVT